MQEFENFVHDKINLFKKEHNEVYVKLYEDVQEYGIRELKSLCDEEW